MVLRNELFFLVKIAVVLAVADGLIPRAETLAKSRMAHRHRPHQHQTTTIKHDGEPSPPRGYRSHQPPLTEMHMGMFDMNPFHGSGSGGTKEALDEQWEIQQEILRARRGDKSHYVKKRTAALESPKKVVQIKGAGTKGHRASAGGEEDVAHHAHASKPKFFWDLGK